MKSYLKGAGDTRWIAIGVSVMATQASAVTFLSLPGQAFESGMSFIQNYFGAALALIIICIFFLPILRSLNVYTAYEYLGRRFDRKTRLLGAGIFLFQRGLAAGITIYAPAIVLSTVLGWPLEATILISGVVIVIYTVVGGSDAVTLTQKYQLGVIFTGMVIAFFVLLAKLPADLSLDDALAVAGGFDKLQTVDLSLDTSKRYTIWSGIFGGMFLALSYFGADQSQVQRYLHGSSLRESRMGLMFNAVLKIPMQFFILLLGALVFVFYQFERPPVFFNQVEWNRQVAADGSQNLLLIEEEFNEIHAEKSQLIQRWRDYQNAGDLDAAEEARQRALEAHARSEAVRTRAKAALVAIDPEIATKDSDYVFITVIFNYLPHGLIGLLVTVFFASTMSSKAGELNALSSTTMVDLYRHIIRRDASDHHYVVASRLITVFWGIVAIAFALMVRMAENLIEFGNIIGSIFYGVPLGLFLIAFFLKRVGGTAVFWSAIIVQALIIVAYFNSDVTGVSYLWLNPLGCGLCVLLSILIQLILGPHEEHPEPLNEP
ncbi:MAG: sodium:solute symporter [Candidatus Nanopelagicales bacterium]